MNDADIPITEDGFLPEPEHAPTQNRSNLGVGIDSGHGGDSFGSVVRSVCCAGGIVTLALTGHVDGTYALGALVGIAIPGILTSILALKGLKK